MPSIAEARRKRHRCARATHGTRPPGIRALASLLLVLCLPFTVRAEDITIFAAASLTDALGAIATGFSRDSGHALQFSFAASSLLARQIEAGAPASIFASASTRWMDYLQDRRLLEPGTRIHPVTNTLVLIAPHGASSAAPGLPPQQSLPTAAALTRLLGPHGRLALGDPGHVPAGIYARQALGSLGLWQGLASRLAYTDNVRAALVLVERGEAPLGIVYGSDAWASDRVRVVGRFPAASHEPIRYPFAILRDRASPGTRALMAYLMGRTAMAAFSRHGFIPAHGDPAHAR